MREIDAPLDAVALRVDPDQAAASVVRDPGLAEGERDPVGLPADADGFRHLVAARRDAADTAGALVRDPDRASPVDQRVGRVVSVVRAFHRDAIFFGIGTKNNRIELNAAIFSDATLIGPDATRG